MVDFLKATPPTVKPEDAQAAIRLDLERALKDDKHPLHQVLADKLAARKASRSNSIKSAGSTPNETEIDAQCRKAMLDELSKLGGSSYANDTQSMNDALKKGSADFMANLQSNSWNLVMSGRIMEGIFGMASSAFQGVLQAFPPVQEWMESMSMWWNKREGYPPSDSLAAGRVGETLGKALGVPGLGDAYKIHLLGGAIKVDVKAEGEKAKQQAEVQRKAAEAQAKGTREKLFTDGIMAAENGTDNNELTSHLNGLSDAMGLKGAQRAAFINTSYIHYTAGGLQGKDAAGAATQLLGTPAVERLRLSSQGKEQFTAIIGQFHDKVKIAAAQIGASTSNIKLDSEVYVVEKVQLAGANPTHVTITTENKPFGLVVKGQQNELEAPEMNVVAQISEDKRSIRILDTGKGPLHTPILVKFDHSLVKAGQFELTDAVKEKLYSHLSDAGQLRVKANSFERVFHEEVFTPPPGLPGPGGVPSAPSP